MDFPFKGLFSGMSLLKKLVTHLGERSGITL